MKQKYHSLYRSMAKKNSKQLFESEKKIILSWMQLFQSLITLDVKYIIIFQTNKDTNVL